MAGLKSRNKGSKWERDLKKLLEDFTGVTWERVRGSGAFERKGDIYPAYHSFPFLIEAKHTEDWDLYDIFSGVGPIINDWWPKIKDESYSVERLPMLICKRNYKAPILILDSKGAALMFRSVKTPAVSAHRAQDDINAYLLEEVIKPNLGKKLVK